MFSFAYFFAMKFTEKNMKIPCRVIVQPIKIYKFIKLLHILGITIPPIKILSLQKMIQLFIFPQRGSNLEAGEIVQRIMECTIISGKGIVSFMLGMGRISYFINNGFDSALQISVKILFRKNVCNDKAFVNPWGITHIIQESSYFHCNNFSCLFSGKRSNISNTKDASAECLDSEYLCTRDVISS